MARSHALDLGASSSRPSSYTEETLALLTQRQTDMARALKHLQVVSPKISEAAQLVIDALHCGNKCLLVGNGGSAAEAQHFAAELVGRFRRERYPYAALALSTDSSIITAISNDYGYEDVFARQVQGLGQKNDLLVAFSTSGESENVVRAAQVARHMGIKIVAVTGLRSGRLGRLAHLTLSMPSYETALIQELHMMVTHILCEIVETELSARDAETDA